MNATRIATPQERAAAAMDRAAVFKAPLRDWQLAYAMVDAVARNPVGTIAEQVIRSVERMNRKIA